MYEPTEYGLNLVKTVNHLKDTVAENLRDLIQKVSDDLEISTEAVLEAVIVESLEMKATVNIAEILMNEDDTE